MHRISALAATLLLAAFGSSPAAALSITEFRKYPADKQAVYISGAVSMTAYAYAANGELARARCVQEWYFGKKGETTPGPRALALEITAAENVDPEKYRVEGVVLGLIEKVCGVSSQSKPKQ